MRKKTYAPAILGITLLLNAACQKDLMPQSEIVRSREDVKTIVEQSRDWYKNHVLVESKNLRKGTSDRSMYIGEPSWEEVAFTKISPTIPEFIRYPLEGYKVDVAYTPKMSPKGYREILFRKLRNNNFIVDVIEMHPDESYVSKKKNENLFWKSRIYGY